MKKVSKIKVTYSLTEPIVEFLKKEAEGTGLTMSAIVILALQEYMKKGGVRGVKK